MRLSLRTQKVGLSIATVGCAAAAVLVVGWGIRLPAVGERTETKTAAEQPNANEAVANAHNEPSKESFAQLCAVQLRRPLYDPPPPAPEVRQLPPLQVQLLGTIIEGENSMAILRSEQGKVEYRKQGDAIGPVDSPATVVEIQGDAVVLNRAEERITLRVNNDGPH
jgi:hypothetical protein